MPFFGPSNQLMQIDTGKATTYLFNQSLSPISVYAGIGENQIPGQRFFGATAGTPAAPFGSPVVYILVKYSSVSQPAPVAAPAPVYWTDNTFTTVSGNAAEAIGGSVNFVAGYLMLSTSTLPTLTAAQLQGALCLIQVAGYLPGATVPAATAIGDQIIGTAATSFTPSRIAAGTAPTNQILAYATSAYVGGTAGILLQCDII